MLRGLLWLVGLARRVVGWGWKIIGFDFRLVSRIRIVGWSRNGRGLSGIWMIIGWLRIVGWGRRLIGWFRRRVGWDRIRIRWSRSIRRRWFRVGWRRLLIGFCRTVGWRRKRGRRRIVRKRRKRVGWI